MLSRPLTEDIVCHPSHATMSGTASGRTAGAPQFRDTALRVSRETLRLHRTFDGRCGQDSAVKWKASLAGNVHGKTKVSHPMTDWQPSRIHLSGFREKILSALHFGAISALLRHFKGILS